MADSMTESRGVGGLAVRGSKSLGPRLTTLIKDVNRELNEAEQPFRLGFTHHGDQRSDPMRREGEEQRDFLPHRAENEHRQDEAARSHSEHNSDSALVPRGMAWEGGMKAMAGPLSGIMAPLPVSRPVKLPPLKSLADHGKRIHCLPTAQQTFILILSRCVHLLRYLALSTPYSLCGGTPLLPHAIP